MRLGTLLGPDIKQLLKEDPEEVRGLLDEIHPEDLADLVSELEPDEAAELLARMPAADAAPIFGRLEEHEQEELVELMPPESVVQIARELPPDDRADLFSALPEDVGDELLEKLGRVDPEAADDVREIEKWPETSAGHLMTTRYIGVTRDITVKDAIDRVREHGRLHQNQPVYNVYSLDSTERLQGVASLRDLLLATPETVLDDVLRENIITVTPEMDQEEVAKRMAKYDLNVMPVIDGSGVMLGVITIDDIIDVLTAEQTEDVQKIGGVEPLEESYFQTSFVTFIKKRVVWLLVLFFGEFFTQTALRHYDPVFEAIHGAAYYVPLLISAGGNSGSQSSTLIIRGLSIGELRMRDWWRILIRETGMGITLGLVLGAFGFARVMILGGDDASFQFAVTIGITLVGIVVTGCTVGSMFPLLLRRAGLDPATSSTPFIASLVDVLGIVVFVYVAKTVMASVITAAVMP
jgi:magnesium transporter